MSGMCHTGYSKIVYFASKLLNFESFACPLTWARIWVSLKIRVEVAYLLCLLMVGFLVVLRDNLVREQADVAYHT